MVITPRSIAFAATLCYTVVVGAWSPPSWVRCCNFRGSTTAQLQTESPQKCRFTPASGGFLSFRHTFPARHAAAILCPLCGSERKKKNASRRRRFSLKFIDNVRARPASNIAVSRVNTGVSHPRPPHPGLSCVSQIRCLLTFRCASSHSCTVLYGMQKYSANSRRFSPIMLLSSFNISLFSIDPPL